MIERTPPGPMDALEPLFFESLPTELTRAVTGAPRLEPAEVPVLWIALMIRVASIRRLLPSYGRAVDGLARGLRPYWRTRAAERCRLAEMYPDIAVEDAAFRVLQMALDATAGVPVPLRNGRFANRSVVYHYIRGFTARTIWMARAIVRGQLPEGMIEGMNRSVEALAAPLDDRVYNQWRRVVGQEVRTHELRDLITAIEIVETPPRDHMRTLLALSLAFSRATRSDEEGPTAHDERIAVTAASGRPANDLYQQALEALTSSLERTWRVRTKAPNDRASLYALSTAENRSPRQIKLDFVRHGLLHTLIDQREPQKIRGRHGYAEGGAPLRPRSDVNVREFFRWLKSESIRRAEHGLRNAEPVRGTEASESLLNRAAPARRPVPRCDARVDALYAAARDDIDRQLLDTCAEGVSIAAAARKVGINPKTAHKRIERLRGRVAAAG